MERARALAESLRFRRDAELTRCAKACFFDETGAPTLEGKFLLADMRKNAKLFGSSIRRRPGDGAIDRDEMLRIEGRREVVLRLINLLELDPIEVARFVEVDNGQL